jgi:hypothetical protein
LRPRRPHHTPPHRPHLLRPGVGGGRAPQEPRARRRRRRRRHLHRGGRTWTRSTAGSLTRPSLRGQLGRWEGTGGTGGTKGRRGGKEGPPPPLLLLLLRRGQGGDTTTTTITERAHVFRVAEQTNDRSERGIHIAPPLSLSSPLTTAGRCPSSAPVSAPSCRPRPPASRLCAPARASCRRAQRSSTPR